MQISLEASTRPTSRQTLIVGLLTAPNKRHQTGNHRLDQSSAAYTFLFTDHTQPPRAACEWITREWCWHIDAWCRKWVYAELAGRGIASLQSSYKSIDDKALIDFRHRANKWINKCNWKRTMHWDVVEFEWTSATCIMILHAVGLPGYNWYRPTWYVVSVLLRRRCFRPNNFRQ